MSRNSNELHEQRGDHERLHREAIVCDLHVDTLQRLALGESLAGPGGHLDLPRMQEGGVNLQFFAAWVDLVYMPGSHDPTDRSFERTCELLDAFDREMKTHAEWIRPVRTAAEAREVIQEGRLAAALGVEGGHAIENDLGKLDELHRRGVRYMTLTWNKTTDWADAAKEESVLGSRHAGLTEFGREVVRHMNKLGMIVDVSHAAESTFWKVMEVCEMPFMASHSNAYALAPHFRNLKDEQIRALAERGGLIGINFYNSFLDAEYARRRHEAEEHCKQQLETIERKYIHDYPRQAEEGAKVLREAMGHVPVPASRIADHIEYICRLVGPDHVALGSDFDGTNALPDDMPDVSCLPLVTRLLHERGFAESDIRKILGENVLRLFATVC